MSLCVLTPCSSRWRCDYACGCLNIASSCGNKTKIKQNGRLLDILHDVICQKCLNTVHLVVFLVFNLSQWLPVYIITTGSPKTKRFYYKFCSVFTCTKQREWLKELSFKQYKYGNLKKIDTFLNSDLENQRKLICISVLCPEAENYWNPFLNRQKTKVTLDAWASPCKGFRVTKLFFF